MQYSFTEKKRIRKSFAKRPIVHQVPFLLATQLESFSTFLQAETIGTQRKAEGLQAAFSSVFPIVSHNGFARLEFVSYMLSPPAFNIKECQQRGLTYCSALRAKVRLVLLDKESPSKPVVICSGRALALITARCWRSWNAGVSNDSRSTAVAVHLGAPLDRSEPW